MAYGWFVVWFEVVVVAKPVVLPTNSHKSGNETVLDDLDPESHLKTISNFLQLLLLLCRFAQTRFQKRNRTAAIVSLSATRF